MQQDKRIRIITGHYGSGKTEFAVNYAIRLADAGKKVAIADMDVVNPYFRSRECEVIFNEKNVEILGFSLKEKGMDLPAISGNIIKAFVDKSYDYVVDLGGNSAGATAFSSFRKQFSTEECDLFIVLNAYRPETADLESAVAQVASLEGTLNMRVTGIINNTHLIWDTTAADVVAGNKLAVELARKLNIPVKYNVCKRDLVDQIPTDLEGEIFPIDMHMRQDWM